MKRSSGKSIYIDKYNDGTLRVTIIENIDILDNSRTDKDEHSVELSKYAPDPECTKNYNVDEDGVILTDYSLVSSISRTRNKIYDIVHNMDIEWFGTLTVSPDFWVNRENKQELKEYLGNWLHNMRKRYAPDLEYLAIPEKHNVSNGYHFHVLLSHCGRMDFTFSGIKQAGRKIYNLKQWIAGFTNFSKVTSAERCANYCMKYITKDLCSTVGEFGEQRYLVSKNICSKETLLKTFIPIENNYQLSTEDFNFGNTLTDNNRKRSDKLVKSLGEYDFSFCNNLDLKSGDFSFHSQRFFYKLKK